MMAKRFSLLSQSEWDKWSDTEEAACHLRRHAPDLLAAIVRHQAKRRMTSGSVPCAGRLRALARALGYLAGLDWLANEASKIKVQDDMERLFEKPGRDLFMQIGEAIFDQVVGPDALAHINDVLDPAPEPIGPPPVAGLGEMVRYCRHCQRSRVFIPGDGFDECMNCGKRVLRVSSKKRGR